MEINKRLRAAWAVFRGKSAPGESMNLDQLLAFLGLSKMEDPDALCEAVYYACIKVLSESIGKLPLKIQQTTPDKGVRIAREHPYYRALNERPNRYMTATTFWAMIQQCRDDQGNGYAWIDSRDPKHLQLWPLDPRTVQVYYDNARLLAEVPDIYYQVSTSAGVLVLGSEEVLHFPGHHTADGIVGVPVRETLARNIMGNVKAQEYLNKLYTSGFTAKAVLQYTGGLDDSKVKVLVKGLETYAKGKLAGTGIENIIPIPVGMQLTPLNLKLADSQFLETKQYTALQIASAFGVKPYQVGDYTKSSYASAEAQQLSFLVDTLLFIVKQYEEEVSYKLLTDEERATGYHVKFNTAVILRADQKTQIETLNMAVQGGLMEPNEARERLDLPHRPGGDQLICNGSTIPLTQIGKQYGAGSTQADNDPPPDDDPPDGDPEGDQPDESPDDHKSLRERRKRHGRKKQPASDLPGHDREGGAAGAPGGDG